MIWKFVHVVGAMLLLGNVVTTGLWSHWAIARRDHTLATFAAGAILLADLWLTLGGGTLLVIGGLMLVMQEQIPWARTPWLQHGVLALALSTGVWLVALLPLQFRLLRQARSGDLATVRRTFTVWSALGWADTALLFWGLWAMVVK